MAPSSPGIPPLVHTEAETAELLGVSPRTLQRMRVEGGGPAYIQLTDRRIGYAVAALTAWLQARSVGSTSEATDRKRRGAAA